MGWQTYRQFSQVAFTVFSLTAFLLWASACNNVCVSGTLNAPSGSTVDVKASSQSPSCALSTANGVMHVEIGVTPGTTSVPGSIGTQMTHLFVSVKGIEVHSSPLAVDDTPGWRAIATPPQEHPVQIDLLANPQANDSTAPFPDAILPSGPYRQIRLRLANKAAEESAFGASPCGAGSPHCAVRSDGRVWSVTFPPSRPDLRIVLDGAPGRELYVPPDGTVSLAIELDRDRSFLWLIGDSMIFTPVFRVRVQQPLEPL